MPISHKINHKMSISENINTIKGKITHRKPKISEPKQFISFSDFKDIFLKFIQFSPSSSWCEKKLLALYREGIVNQILLNTVNDLISY